MQIKVRALPAPGHEFRRRIGRVFSRAWTNLDVVESPSKPDEISALQYQELQSDPRITAMPVAADDAQDLHVAGRIAELEAEIRKQRLELAAAAESYEENARGSERAAREAAEKITKLEGENEHLRAELSRMKPKK